MHECSYSTLVMAASSTLGGGHTTGDSFDQAPDHVPIASARTRWLKIEDRIFTERRIRFYAAGVVLALALSVAWDMWHGKSVFDLNGNPICLDFCTIWVSGTFAASSNPLLVYEYPIFSLAQRTLVAAPLLNYPPFHYWYPPTFLFFTYPLGAMTYLTGFVVWTVATFLLYMGTVYAVISRLTTLIAAATPFVVAENVMLGNNGFLTAAFIGLSLVFLERQPWLSGVFIGLMTYKPQFGVLFPLVLLASRNWRAFGSALLTTATLGVGSAIAFGYRGWPLFIDTLRDRNSSLSLDPGLELTLQSVYGMLHWSGASVGISWTLHLAIAAVVTLATCAVSAKQMPHSLRAATICIGAVAVTPYVQIYDLCVLPIAVAFFIKDGLSRGFLPGERPAILACLTGLFFLLMPVGPIIYAVLLVLVARRILAYFRSLAPSPAFSGLANRSSSV
jgi:arabinofuranan 3-O-arabinosyltransferase